MGSMVYAYPPNVRKFEIIGGLFGEPYRVARCGIADLEVPAGAEIIIEGEMLAHEREPEGPFSEFTGYASFRSTQNVFVAKRVRMRNDAIFHSVVSGMSQDHILVSCITREGEILNTLRRNLPNVKAVHVPHTTCGAFMAFISMKKTSAGEPQQAIMAALGTEFYTKYVIVVDDDVDVFNLADVMWAVATRVRAEKDIIFIPGAKGAILDPTSDPDDFTLTKMGIDATKPLGRDFAARLTISEEQQARVRGILAKAGGGRCARLNDMERDCRGCCQPLPTGSTTLPDDCFGATARELIVERVENAEREACPDWSWPQGRRGDCSSRRRSAVTTRTCGVTASSSDRNVLTSNVAAALLAEPAAVGHAGLCGTSFRQFESSAS